MEELIMRGGEVCKKYDGKVVGCEIAIKCIFILITLKNFIFIYVYQQNCYSPEKGVLKTINGTV